MKEERSPRRIVEASAFEVSSVIVTPSTMTAASTSEVISEETPVTPAKKMADTVIIAGKRPLHGMKLLVRIAISRSRFESMMRAPTTPAALQPSPIHIVSACLPHALHLENMPSRLKATRGR